MIYYECYHITKSYNFNTKLNYIFNNMEHQALVTLVAVRVTTIAPNHMFKIDLNRFLKNASGFCFTLWVAQRNKVSFKR